MGQRAKLLLVLLALCLETTLGAALAPQQQQQPLIAPARLPADKPARADPTHRNDLDRAISDWLDPPSNMAQTKATPKVTGLPGQLVMLGDSLTQYSFKPGGTGAALADAWQRKLDVVNRGYAGWTADMLRYVAPWILTSATPIQILGVWVGTNDMNTNRPVKDYEADVEDLAKSFFQTRPESQQRSPSSATLHDPVLMLMSAPPNLLVPLKRSQSYADAVESVASRMKKKHPRRVLYVDIHAAIVQKAQLVTSPETAWEQLKALMPDGVHLNEQGYEVVTWHILNAVNSQAHHLYPASLPESFPPPFDTKSAANLFPPLPDQPDCREPIKRAKPPLKH